MSGRRSNAAPQPYAASPLLVFKLGIANADFEEPIHTIALRCQIQIEATRRRYSAQDQERLLDLFGEPARWSQTLRTMLWMDIYYPNSAWLCLRRDVFDRLSRYKMRRGIPTWEQTLESLLRDVEEESSR